LPKQAFKDLTSI